MEELLKEGRPLFNLVFHDSPLPGRIRIPVWRLYNANLENRIVM